MIEKERHDRLTHAGYIEQVSKVPAQLELTLIGAQPGTKSFSKQLQSSATGGKVDTGHDVEKIANAGQPKVPTKLKVDRS